MGPGRFCCGSSIAIVSVSSVPVPETVGKADGEELGASG